MRARLILVGVLVGALYHHAHAAWLATGPFGGAAEIVRTVPKQPNMVLAATGNGLLYQSLDGGASWTHRFFPAQSAGTIHALEVDPRSPGSWYAGVESENPSLAGLYKTDDAGATWKLLPDLTGKSVWSLALWPALPDLIAAGTNQGVFLSRDAGASWTRISPESNTELRPVVSLAFHPADRDTIYAGTTHLPWRTRDGGAHWESVHSGMLDDSDVFSIAVERQYPPSVFASACGGVYHSTNGGSSWKRLATPPGAFRTYLVTLDPRHSGVVFAATSAGLLRSHTAGAVWKRVSPHAVKSIAFDPAAPNRIYFASVTAGLLISSDGGNTLTESNLGFSNRNFAAATGAGSVLYASSVYEPGTGGIFRTTNYGLNWSRMTTPGTNENVLLLAAAPDNPDSLYALGYRSLFRSTDGARTWIRQPLPENTGRITALLPLSRDSLLAGTPTGLFRRRGAAWTPVSFPGAGRRPVEQLQSSGGSLVAAITPNGAFRSEDGGLSWTACAQPAPDAVWYGLALDSGPSGRALAATSQGLFRSADRCASWTPARGGLDQSTVSAVVFHPQHPGEAFAAQFGQIFQTLDGGLSWRPLADEGRNGAFPSALLLLPAAPRRLFALFPRRGILSTTTAETQAAQSLGEN